MFCNSNCHDLRKPISGLVEPMQRISISTANSQSIIGINVKLYLGV